MSETSNFCTPICDPIWACTKCINSLEDAAIKSATNMGIPDCFYCGECGLRFETVKEFTEHLTC
jgi:hypothetical protein